MVDHTRNLSPIPRDERRAAWAGSRRVRTTNTPSRGCAQTTACERQHPSAPDLITGTDANADWPIPRRHHARGAGLFDNAITATRGGMRSRNPHPHPRVPANGATLGSLSHTHHAHCAVNDVLAGRFMGQSCGAADKTGGLTHRCRLRGSHDREGRVGQGTNWTGLGVTTGRWHAGYRTPKNLRRLSPFTPMLAA